MLFHGYVGQSVENGRNLALKKDDYTKMSVQEMMKLYYGTWVFSLNQQLQQHQREQEVNELDLESGRKSRMGGDAAMNMI